MTDALAGLSKDERIVREARKRFEACEAWESSARANWIDDFKFVYADDLNGWQWPHEMRTVRQRDQRPCLTINKTRQHCLQVINDARQNKVAIKVSPTGDQATKEAADVFEGLIRHIEYRSVAQSAYDEASRHQVCAGLGFWRVLTEYEDDGFDQEIRIQRIADPLSVYLDPDSREADCSDARYGFVFADRPRDEVETEYPRFKDRIATANGIDGQAGSWIRDDHIRECEYYRVVEKSDTLLAMPDGTIAHASEIAQPMRDIALRDATKTRDVISRKVEWYKIVGDEIVDRRDWPGKYIPIVPVIGEETVVDGQMDRRGHARALRDPQRMYNYASSAAVEGVALQSKAPWLTPAAAIEGYETYWATANTVPHSFLPWNHKDDQGGEIPSPQRQEPPQAAPAFLQMMETSANELMMVSGQYQAEMGAPGNERTGIAIQQRQRQGDTATYHFIDGLARAIRFTGRILIDLIPEIYDTERVVRILAEDGSETQVQIDPSHPQAHTSSKDDAAAIFNPSVGKYDVQADVGPEFATRRQETFNALVQLMAASPELINRVGDLMMKAADFPMAEEIAERLQPGPPPQLQAMQQQLTQKMAASQKLLDQTMQALAEERLKTKAKDIQKGVDIYEAETRRMAALHDALLSDPMTHQLVRQLVNEAVQNSLSDASAADDTDLKADAAGAPIAGGGALPAKQPDVGQQMATPGGQ